MYSAKSNTMQVTHVGATVCDPCYRPVPDAFSPMCASVKVTSYEKLQEISVNADGPRDAASRPIQLPNTVQDRRIASVKVE